MFNLFDLQAVQLRLYTINGKMVVCQSVVLQIYTVKKHKWFGSDRFLRLCLLLLLAAEGWCRLQYACSLDEIGGTPSKMWISNHEHVVLMGFFTLALAGRGGRGRFSGGGRGYSRGGGDEYNSNRGRSNGYGRAPHQERGILGSHTPRN